MPKPRPDGRYQKKITITVNGRKKSKFFYGKSEAELNRKILNYTGEVERGLLFSKVAYLWEKEHWEKVSFGTQRCYKAPLERAISYFDECYIREITPVMINTYINQIVNYGFAKRTVKIHLLVISLLYKFAINNGYCETNPTQYIEIPKNLHVSKRETLSEKEIEVVKSSQSKTFGTFANFLLYTGLRKSEALALS